MHVSASRFSTLTQGMNYSSQSSGIRVIPQTFPGSSSARPRSHLFSNLPREMQLITRAATRKRVGRPSRWTTVPMTMGRGERAAHPPRFAKMTWQCSENACRGSLLVTTTGISHGMRVPPRSTAFCGLEPHVPKLQVRTESGGNDSRKTSVRNL